MVSLEDSVTHVRDISITFIHCLNFFTWIGRCFDSILVHVEVRGQLVGVFSFLDQMGIELKSSDLAASSLIY